MLGLGLIKKLLAGNKEREMSQNYYNEDGDIIDPSELVIVEHIETDYHQEAIDIFNTIIDDIIAEIQG